MRDLTKITLVRDDTPAGIGKKYPHAGPLLAARWNEDLVADCWSDLLRMGGSLKYGQASASLIVGKWSAASRQNTMAAALKEWGMLRRTIHTAKYLSDPAYRRRISRQLNKGESLHVWQHQLLRRHQRRHRSRTGQAHRRMAATAARPAPRPGPVTAPRPGADRNEAVSNSRRLIFTGSSAKTTIS
jgi:hypothetical protein